MPSATLGQALSTNTARRISPTPSLHWVVESDQAQPITPAVAGNNSFANRDDITDENGPVPTSNLTLANTQSGEYTNGLLATLWWEWTCPYHAPYEVEWSFDWAGQSGSGGAAIRVYAPSTLDQIPGSSSIVAQGTGNGAAGTVSATLTPVSGRTYYIQQGIEEKAGTASFFTQTITWEAPVSPFTPVIP